MITLLFYLWAKKLGQKIIKIELDDELSSLDENLKKYNLEIKTVVRPFDQDETFQISDEAYPGPGVLINSDFLNGLKAPENSVLETIKILAERNLGQKKINYRLKDWEFRVKDIGDVQFP